MGFKVGKAQMNDLFQQWTKEYDVYAPKRFVGGGRYADTDCVRYGNIQSVEEVVFSEKSSYSFKEVLMPISQTLFFFTDGQTEEAAAPKKGAIIFLRSCDLHALKRMDQMYLHNGPEDYYYRRLRDGVKFVLMGCAQSFDSCFCVSMGTNQAEHYDLSIDVDGDGYRLDCKDADWAAALVELQGQPMEVVPAHVTANKKAVRIPDQLDARVAKSQMWSEYDSRCIACGRCNVVCPTCTCFTMQDLFYSENGKVGERRRVWAACMVDGFTDVAGGGSYRKTKGERMRFKVLHKVLDYKERNGVYMCVGCGRCDDICPEYISYASCVNKLEAAMQEVSEHDEK